MSKISSTIWGGRFKDSPSQIMLDINESISIDKRLYKEDIIGSIAHCEMLEQQNIISIDDSNKIISGLQQILIEIEENKFRFKKDLEDIHMNIESRLQEIIGEIAGKLHTARSRNDQVATDTKLFTRKANRKLKILLINLITIFINKANKHIETYMPGFTHLQTAQPISFAHHLLAYVEMFLRDIDRIDSAISRMNTNPLGAAALAGTSFNIDRNYTTKLLEFAEPTRNSIDSVSDRDFILDFLYNASVIGTHLSRFSEENYIMGK